MKTPRWAPPLAGLAVLLLLGMAPGIFSAFMIQFLINLFMMTILAESWNIIGGFTGYTSFGNAAFFGIGAYTTGVLLTRAGLPFALALPAGGILAMLFGVAIGVPVLRLKGQYFAIATLGIGETMREVVYNM